MACSSNDETVWQIQIQSVLEPCGWAEQFRDWDLPWDEGCSLVPAHELMSPCSMCTSCLGHPVFEIMLKTDLCANVGEKEH